jgi:hypothetical protein
MFKSMVGEKHLEIETTKISKIMTFNLGGS